MVKLFYESTTKSIEQKPTDNENITTQDEVDDYAKYLIEAIK
jgi:hypothetical protein